MEEKENLVERESVARKTVGVQSDMEMKSVGI